MNYKDFIISFDPLPVPILTMDWDWCHKDYDGPGDNRCGRASSEAAAKQAIDDFLEEQ